MKGISSAPAITIHASKAFSAAHVNTAPEEVGHLIAEAAAPLLQNKIMSIYPHCWRYGTPANTLQKNFYLVDGRAPLYFAGDAFCGITEERNAIELLPVRHCRKVKPLQSGRIIRAEGNCLC